MILQSPASFFRFFVVGALLYLTGCGSALKSMSSSQAVPQEPAPKIEGSHGVVQIPLRPDESDSTNAGAKFQGCWYKSGRHYYQAVDLTVADPGIYTFNANLYYGTTCDPSTQADEFGFGQEIDFGGFGYIFWFTAFANKPDMSAIWQVGSDTSKCVNYKTAPLCP